MDARPEPAHDVGPATGSPHQANGNGRASRADENIDDLLASLDRERELNDQLRRLDQLKTDFLATVAHDLRTPVTVVSGFAEMLRNEWKTVSDGEKRSMIERLANNAMRLGDVVENLLQFARIESGELSYDIQPFDFGALVRRTVMEQARPDGVERFRLEMTDDLPWALGDDKRNWQVLINLLTNAAKFSAPDAPIVVRVSPGDGFLHVSVSDSGPGMSQDDMTRLFTKFGRIERSSGPRASGTGLGLYIAKSIVEAQGGRIWAESEEGVGTTFTYTIPIAGHAGVGNPTS